MENISADNCAENSVKNWSVEKICVPKSFRFQNTYLPIFFRLDIHYLHNKLLLTLIISDGEAKNMPGTKRIYLYENPVLSKSFQVFVASF